ncbi:hypothetical protein ABVF11_02175 [Pediococcus argentinicus]|uniref:hypothetical protein n=1 Tax=Pediococcus argentinicus TaxID=480391 RepID=UPI00338FFD1A
MVNTILFLGFVASLIACGFAMGQAYEASGKEYTRDRDVNSTGNHYVNRTDI